MLGQKRQFPFFLVLMEHFLGIKCTHHTTNNLHDYSISIFRQNQRVIFNVT